MSINHQVKVIGTNGQLSLGKEFAGKMVLIDRVDEGTWIIKSGEFIPDSEKWLYQGNNLIKLQKALEWAKNHPPVDNFEKLVKDIEHDGN
ncbi:hypothetical protein BH10PSE19_BH10PSE19_13860 [soil metagenome]